MSVIETAETAAWSALLAQGVQCMPELGDVRGEVDMQGLVRAVMQAIREPSEAMIYANSEGGLGFNDRVVRDWQAMIDAALEEG